MRRVLPDLLDETGGILSGLVVLVLVVAGVAVAAFFFLGGQADVNIKPPDKTVTTAPAN